MAFNKQSGLYEGYIYKIVNDVNDKIYIGQTTTTLKQRMNSHLYQSRKNKSNSVLYSAIQKYGEDHFSIISIQSYTAESKNELVNILNKEEIYYIHEFNSLLPNGYNLSHGGGQFSVTHSFPVCAYDINGNLIAEYPTATAAAIDVNGSLSNILLCCNGKLRYANHYIWRFKDDAFNLYMVDVDSTQISNGRKRPVNQYSLSGEFLKQYGSITEAASVYGVPSAINYCCLHRSKSAYGYIWCYSDECPELPNINNIYLHRKVKQYSLTGELLNIYSGSTAAANKNFLKNGASNITSCCKRKQKTAYGFVWRYEEDDF